MHVRFLCVANSIRSQMAEGAFRSLADESFSVSSAGLFEHYVDPTAEEVMKEVGVDISSHVSKSLDDLTLPRADLVVDLTDDGVHRERFRDEKDTIYLNRPVEDPVTVSRAPAEVRLPAFRVARDKIFSLVKDLLTTIKGKGPLSSEADGRGSNLST